MIVVLAHYQAISHNTFIKAVNVLKQSQANPPQLKASGAVAENVAHKTHLKNVKRYFIDFMRT